MLWIWVVGGTSPWMRTHPQRLGAAETPRINPGSLSDPTSIAQTSVTPKIKPFQLVPALAAARTKGPTNLGGYRPSKGDLTKQHEGLAKNQVGHLETNIHVQTVQTHDTARGVGVAPQHRQAPHCPFLKLTVGFSMGGANGHFADSGH